MGRVILGSLIAAVVMFIWGFAFWVVSGIPQGALKSAPDIPAAQAALEGPQDCVREIRDMYQKRRDVLCDGLNALGWQVEKPRATMFVWAPIPERYRHLGSLEFSMKCLQEAHVVVTPGIGFGDGGEGHIRIALVENEDRLIVPVTRLPWHRRRDGPIRGKESGVNLLVLQIGEQLFPNSLHHPGNHD